MRLHILLCVYGFLSSPFATATLSELTIKAPRGTEIPVIVHNTALVQPRAVLVIAPGQSCNFRNLLFETLGHEGEKAAMTIIRFEWSYCSQKRQIDRGPSENLGAEYEDMQTVLTFAQNYTFGDYQRLIIGGKSLGSIVAYKLFSVEKSLKALVLFTPVCSNTTDAQEQPFLTPIPLSDSNYPNLKDETRPILMTLGDRDPLCLLPLLYDFLKDAKTGSISTIVGIGDHGFRSYTKDKEIDEMQTRANIRSILPPVLNWIAVQAGKN